MVDNMVQIGEVCTVLTVSGEFVGKLALRDSTTIILDDPRMLIQNQDGNMGFAHGVCVTGVKDPKQVEFLSVVFLTRTNDDIEKAYRSAVSGIIL